MHTHDASSSRITRDYIGNGRIQTILKTLYKQVPIVQEILTLTSWNSTLFGR